METVLRERDPLTTLELLFFFHIRLFCFQILFPDSKMISFYGKNWNFLFSFGYYYLSSVPKVVHPNFLLYQPVSVTLFWVIAFSLNMNF